MGSPLHSSEQLPGQKFKYLPNRPVAYPASCSFATKLASCLVLLDVHATRAAGRRVEPVVRHRAAPRGLQIVQVPPGERLRARRAADGRVDERVRRHRAARLQRSRVCGIGVAPSGAVVGKEPPSTWSWSSVRMKMMLGGAAAHA